MDFNSHIYSSNSIIVSSGDTLSQLAQDYGTTVNELVEINGISNPDLIYVGQEITLPDLNSNENDSLDYSIVDPSDVTNTDVITVSSGETLSQIAQDSETTVEELVQLNEIINPDLIYAGQEIQLPDGSINEETDITTEGGDPASIPSGDWAASTESPGDSQGIPREIQNPSTEDNENQTDVPSSVVSIDSGLEEIRFNDLNGDQSNVHGFDLSTSDDSDALYGYVGEDSEGAWVAGTGVVDFENSDEESWLSGFEILTAEGKGNILGTFEQDDFWGAEFDAQVIEADFNIKGHGVNVGYLNFDGTYGGDSDGFGLMFNANYADITYSNGAPSASNSNDIGFTIGGSAGAGGGLNLVYSDPDNDGITNLGFDLSAGPLDIGFTSEYLGQKAETGLEAAGSTLVEKIYEIDDAVDEISGWFSGGGIFG